MECNFIRRFVTQKQSMIRLLRSYTDSFCIRSELNAIAKSTKPVIIGPWISEVGFELIYWIPFLTWMKATYPGLDQRIVAIISRGGVSQWYKHLSTKYFDIFDYISAADFKKLDEQRIAAYGGSRKQMRLSYLEKMIMSAIRQDIKVSDALYIHPSLMYRLFNPYWTYYRSFNLVAKHVCYKRFSIIDSHGLTKNLPLNYIAVKFYTSDHFPDTETNRNTVEKFINQLSRAHDVVILNTSLNIDDHSDFPVESSRRVHTLQHALTPSNNLELQTIAIARARAFIGTYGGLIYLGPICDTASIAINAGIPIAPHHLQSIYWGAATMGTKALSIADINGFGDIGKFPASTCSAT